MYAQVDAGQRGNKMLNSSRDKNEGTSAMGRGDECPRGHPGSELNVENTQQPDGTEMMRCSDFFIVVVLL